MVLPGHGHLLLLPPLHHLVPMAELLLHCDLDVRAVLILPHNLASLQLSAEVPDLHVAVGPLYVSSLPNTLVK